MLSETAGDAGGAFVASKTSRDTQPGPGDAVRIVPKRLEMLSAPGGRVPAGRQLGDPEHEAPAPPILRQGSQAPWRLNELPWRPLTEPERTILRQGQPIVSLGAKGSHIVKHGGTLHNANEAIRAWLAVAAERPRTVAATCHRTLFIQHAGVTCQFTPSMDRILAYFSVHERDYLSRGSTRATQLSVLPLSGEELLHGLRLGDLPLSYSNTAMASYRKRWASAERPSSAEARVLASAAIAALVQEEPVVHTANIELSHRLMCLKNDRRTSEIWIFEPDGRRVKGYIGPPPPA